MVSPGVVALIAIPIILRGFGKLFPVKTLPPALESLDVLQARYGKWEWVMGMTMLLIVAPCIYVFWLLFRRIAVWWDAAVLPPADMMFSIAPLYWLLPAMCLAVPLSWPAVSRLTRHHMGARYEEFLAFQSLKYRCDSNRTTRFSLMVFLVFAVLLFCGGLGVNVLLAGDELLVGSFFLTGETHYPLSSVEKITTAAHLTAPNGDIVNRREYLVRFKGGRKWSTNSLPSDPDPDRSRQLIEAISKRSGVPVEELALFNYHDL